MKDYLRDYATAAFRFYAKNGKSSEKYKVKIYSEALEEGLIREGNRSGISKPTEAAVMAAERAVNLKLAEIKDMEAVEKVLAELDVKGRRDMVQAIEYVYFSESDNEDIKAKVHIAEIFIPASERSIYYWLRQARNLFAVERGLRVEK